ncbi:hypothetical protein G3A43_07285 [Paraburkholderia aspalathi]|nr:hypothetical protein [Paraburkholderia aspalathi]MBK3780056.1 hypothetical protein [Paraburkholderia aspalathi]
MEITVQSLLGAGAKCMEPEMEGLIKVLQHSLGLNEFGEGRQYRNHFVAGGRDIAVCQKAVALGHMQEHPASVITGGSAWFSVTPAGINYVALNSPKRTPAPILTRSQKRYRRFLDYGDMFESFIDFCRWDAEPERSWN